MIEITKFKCQYIFFQGLRIQNIYIGSGSTLREIRPVNKVLDPELAPVFWIRSLDIGYPLSWGHFSRVQSTGIHDWNTPTRKESRFSMSSFVIVSKFSYSQQGSDRMNTKRPTLVFFLGPTKPLLSPAPAIQC